MKKLQDVMTKDVETCKPSDDLFQAATKMKDLNVGIIPVCDESKNLMGVVTDRDLVIRGYADKKPGSTEIREVMSDRIYSASPDTTLQEASSIMAKEQIRRLPVVESQRLVGIVALGDLALDDMSNEAAGRALEEISERDELH